MQNVLNCTATVSNNGSLSLLVSAQSLGLVHLIKIGHFDLLPAVSAVIRKMFEERGSFLKKYSCLINLISYVLFQKQGGRGAPDSQKDPTVDRSFLSRCGKQKWRFSLHNGTLQHSSKMERFLYGIKMSTFFLLLVCHSL
jgi:hypothetical protein